jgi:DNA-binding MarR family transcriptional regulator
MDAYLTIFLACHRLHVRDDSRGNLLTENQASILNHLHETRPTRPSKLAEHMGVGRSTMSITVARLVKGGYIARQHDSGDARRIGLTLTKAGVRIREQNTVLDPALISNMLHLMDPAECELSLKGVEGLAKYASVLLRNRNRGRNG